MKRSLLGVLLTFTLVACHSKIGHIHSDVTSHYTAEEINYFYECCFNDLGYTPMRKWGEGIFYRLEGNAQPTDSLVLHGLADWFNAQSFSIPMQQANNEQQANLRIVFRDSLHNRTIEAYGSTSFYGKSTVEEVEVEVLDTLKGNLRNAVLEHELLHALGLTHVTTDYHSLMAVFSSPTRFIDNLKEQTALRMLYGYEWPKNFSDNLFEATFAEQLYHVNGVKKFHDYVKSTGISRNILDTMYRYSMVVYGDTLNPPQLYKQASRLPVFVTGEVPQAVRDSLPIVLKELNQVAPLLQLEIGTSTPYHGGIYFNFVKDNAEPEETVFAPVLLVKYTTKNRLNLLYDLRVTIHYNEKYRRFAHMLGTVLYEAAALSGRSSWHVPRKVFETDSTGFHLKPFYRQLLEVYYSPHLPHNFTKSQLEEVMLLMAADSINAAKQQ